MNARGGGQGRVGFPAGGHRPPLPCGLPMEGFLYDDWGAEETDEAQRALSKAVADGEIDPLVTVLGGWGRVPEAFASLYGGHHVGKLVVKVS